MTYLLVLTNLRGGDEHLVAALGGEGTHRRHAQCHLVWVGVGAGARVGVRTRVRVRVRVRVGVRVGGRVRGSS